MPMRSVRVSRSDTAVTPFDSGVFASRTLYRAGQAVFEAAADAKAKILTYAGLVLEASPDDLDFSGGRIAIRGAPWASIDLSLLLRKGLRGGYDFGGCGDAKLTSAPTSGAQFAQVGSGLTSTLARYTWSAL